jgi:hypothetical protein
MTSQVSEQLISYNQNYPVAGQDNDSQQFRTNFTVIKNALNQADTEITDLQNNTAKTNVDTDFNETTIENAFYKNMYGVVAVETGNQIDVDSAEFWIINANADKTVMLQNWPTSGTSQKHFKIRLLLKTTNSTAYQITFQSESGGKVFRDDSTKFSGTGGLQTISTPALNTSYILLEASTITSGDTVFLRYLGTFIQE